MTRDWITTGRRPAGLCGASIIIAARYHGFNRTINQIISVVNVCDETIKIRLREFSKTEVANLTKEEFESFDINTNMFDSKHPPSFSTNRVKDNLHDLGIKNPYSLQYKEKAKEIQKLLEKDKSKSKYTGARLKFSKKSKFAKIKNNENIKHNEAEYRNALTNNISNNDLNKQDEVIDNEETLSQDHTEDNKNDLINLIDGVKNKDKQKISESSRKLEIDNRENFKAENNFTNNPNNYTNDNSKSFKAITDLKSILRL